MRVQRGRKDESSECLRFLFASAGSRQMFPPKLPGRVKAVRHPAMSISDACKENLVFPQLPLLAKDAAGSVNATSASCRLG